MSLLRGLFTTRRRDAGRKAPAVADAPNPAAAPAEAAAFTIDYDKLAGALTKALKPALDTQQAAITEAIATRLPPQATAQPPQPQAGQQQPAQQQPAAALTRGDIEQMFAAERQRTQQDADRGAYVAANLGKLPEAYKRQLGADPAKWDAEATAIQAQFERDFKAAGGKPETIASLARDGGTPAAQLRPDFTKRDGYSLLSEAMEGERAVAVREDAGGGLAGGGTTPPAP